MIEKKNFYINGKWVSPVKPNDFEVIDPSTEEAFAIISLGSVEDADNAIDAAKKAFENWRETTKEERLKLLQKFYEIYNRRWDEMGTAQSKKWEPHLILLQKFIQKWVLIFQKIQ